MGSFSKFIFLVVDLCPEYEDFSMYFYPNVNAYVVITHFSYKVLLQCVLHTNSDFKKLLSFIEYDSFFCA